MSFNEFTEKYLGMIIGILIALLFIAFGLVDIFVNIAVIVGAGWLGKYIQTNKEVVKEKLIGFINKF